jgi:TRAP-type C4-dicarboxylate transport system substrate-binding protein
MSSICDQVNKALKENEETLKRAAKKSGMTVQELEDLYWEDEAKAREEVDKFLADKKCPPVQWCVGTNAQLLLFQLKTKK